MSINGFVEHYQNRCARNKYNFSQVKAEFIYKVAKELIPVRPKDELTKKIIRQTIEQFNIASRTVEQIRLLMNETASGLPEYAIVMGMNGGESPLEPQLIAEIGDVSRFTHKSAIIVFAGVNSDANQSDTYKQKSVHASKRGSAELRKTLFQVVDCLIKTVPQEDSVYCLY